MRHLPDASTAPLAHRPARFRLDDVAAAAPTPAPTPRRRPALPPTSRPPAGSSPRSTPSGGPGEPSAQAGELAALELLHEIFHLLVERAAELQPPTAMAVTADAVGTRWASPRSTGCSTPWATSSRTSRATRTRPPRGAAAHPRSPTRTPPPDRCGCSWTTRPCPRRDRTAAIAALEAYQAAQTPIGPDGETLVELLRAPARAHPTSLAGQLRYVREHWGELLGGALDALLDRMLLTLDVIAEEERGLHLRFGGGGAGEAGAGGARRGAGPDRARGGAGAVLERFRLDAAPGPHRQEHARLAGPAVAPVRARHPDPGRDPRRGARPARAAGDHRPLADRPVGARRTRAGGSRSGAATRMRRRRRTRSTTT